MRRIAVILALAGSFIGLAACTGNPGGANLVPNQASPNSISAYPISKTHQLKSIEAYPI